MDKGEKRSFDDTETSSSVDEYVYSATEHRVLDEWAAQRPPFKREVVLDMDTKMAALKASTFTVSLVSFSGEQMVSQACGTIIETEENNNTVLTSLNLIRKTTEADCVENTLAENLKIIVRSQDGRSYIAQIVVCDFHYNLLVVNFKSKAHLLPATLIKVDEDFGIDRSFQLRPHSSKVKPGDPVVVVGRYFYRSFHFMAALGCFSMDRRKAAEYDCRELLSINCDISRCGDGAPVINLAGKVVGIQFYELSSTNPFLPMNVISKWWSHYLTHKELRHPSYGFDARNMYLASLPTLESITTCFPHISNGILVNKVLPESNAEFAGLCKNDVITKCNGKSVKTFLELWEIIWDKVGETAVLEVSRVNLGTTLSINMVVGEATTLNKWPRYDFG